MKKIVVTGATSMLGVATIEECLDHGIEVIAIAHRNSKNLHRLPESEYLKVIEKNLDELAEYMPASNDADAFYHFGWVATSNEGRTNVDIQELNIRYTLEAVRLAKRFGCKKFIFAGSQAEYGLSDKPLNRNTPINPFTAYGVSKYAAGKLSELLCNDLNLTFIWARILSVYGFNDGPNTLISYIIDCYSKGIQPVLTSCEQIWDYLNSEDAGQAFRLLGEKSNGGIYTLGSGEGKPLKTYVETIHKLMKPNVLIEFGGKPYAENQVMYLQADISDLQRDTGFKPHISFENGINSIINRMAGGGVLQ